MKPEVSDWKICKNIILIKICIRIVLWNCAWITFQLGKHIDWYWAPCHTLFNILLQAFSTSVLRFVVIHLLLFQIYIKWEVVQESFICIVVFITLSSNNVLAASPYYLKSSCSYCITTCTHWHLVLVRVLLVEVQEKRQTISSRGVSSTTCTTATNSSSTPH